MWPYFLQENSVNYSHRHLFKVSFVTMTLTWSISGAGITQAALWHNRTQTRCWVADPAGHQHSSLVVLHNKETKGLDRVRKHLCEVQLQNIAFSMWSGVVFFWDRQVGRMEERAVSGPVAAISPVQQMLASGTGALLTSIFGEITETKTRKSNVCLCFYKCNF